MKLEEMAFNSAGACRTYVPQKTKTIKEVSESLGIGYSSLMNWAAKGLIKAPLVKPLGNKTRMVRKMSIEEYNELSAAVKADKLRAFIRARADNPSVKFSDGTEDGGQRTEDGGRKTEDGRRRTEDGGRKTEDRGRKTEDGGQRTEDGGRKTEDGRRRTEDRGRKTEDGTDKSEPPSREKLLASNERLLREKIELTKRINELLERIRELEEAADGGQRAEDRGQRTEDGGRKTEPGELVEVASVGRIGQIVPSIEVNVYLN